MIMRSANGVNIYEPAPGEVFEIAEFPELGPLVMKFNEGSIFDNEGNQKRTVCAGCTLHQRPMDSKLACLLVACSRHDRSDNESLIVVVAP